MMRKTRNVYNTVEGHVFETFHLENEEAQRRIRERSCEDGREGGGGEWTEIVSNDRTWY
jgi:hypothetical protein